MKRMFIALALVFVLGCSREDNRGTDRKDSAGAGRELRTMILTTTSEKLGFVADPDYSKVYGVLTDWNINEETASIVSMKDGMASLYTTTAFGIIGGEGHESVRQAAQQYVKIAGQYYDTSAPVSDFPYPSRGKVNFYLLTYDGVRLCIGYQAGIDKGTDPTVLSSRQPRTFSPN